MAELVETALRPSVDTLYAAIDDARAALFREGRVCVDTERAVELRAEIGRLSDAIRRAEKESRGDDLR